MDMKIKFSLMTSVGTRVSGSLFSHDPTISDDVEKIITPTDVEVAKLAQVIAFMTSGVNNAMPEDVDYRLAMKYHSLIESEIE